MKWNSKQTFEKLKEAGVVKTYDTFMRMVRETRIPATFTSKKKGYRFHKEDVLTFIARYSEDDAFSMTEEMNRLRAENEEWAKKWAMPRDYWILENAELKKRLQDVQKEADSLRKRLAQMVDDRTIRIRVE